MPTKFRFGYIVLLDAGHRYATIQFTLDRWGDIMTREEISGLKTCGPSGCQFAIDYLQALEIGKANGLILDHEHKYFLYLRWARTMQAADTTGDYELVIAALKNSQKGGKNETIENYDAVILNPWTGKTIRKTRMQRFRYTHRYSSSASGLIEKM